MKHCNRTVKFCLSSIPLYYKLSNRTFNKMSVLYSCVFVLISHCRSNNNNHTIQNSVCPLDYDSIERWLQAIKMDRYIDTFKQNSLLQPKDCLGLTHTTLMDMGITLSGHQHKILSSIQTATSRLQREPSYKIWNSATKYWTTIKYNLISVQFL